MIEFKVSKQLDDVSSRAIRVIEVPFEVPSDGNVEVASVSESVPLSLTPGLYALRCEFFEKNEDGALPVRLVLIPSTSPVFAILRADKELRAPLELATEAQPAM